MRTLLLCALVLLCACQSREVLPLPAPLAPLAHDHADLGTIKDLASGETLTAQQLVERLAVAERVVIGEHHDNPDHHALQLWLSRELSARQAQGSVLMEMINPDQQARIDQAQRDSRVIGSLLDPIDALAWQPGWSWSLYGPLVQYQLRQPYPLLAANLDRAEILDIYRKRPLLQGDVSTTEAVRQRLLADIRRSHCGMLPESQLPAMLAVQQQRDRRMAEVMLAAPQPSLLLAGAFHARKDLGVPLHLADLGGAGGTVVLILAEAGQPVDEHMADYVWYTAAMPQDDLCSSLKS